MRTITKSLAIFISFTQTFFKKRIAVICLFIMAYTGTSAQILPSGSLGNWSNAGVQGGIPEYPNGVNVRDYGATGGGTADDTNAILTAIAECNEEEAVFFPTGTYLVTSSIAISSSIVLRGEDWKTTQITLQGEDVQIRVNSNWAGLENIHIHTDYPPNEGYSGTKIQFNDTENSWIRNIETSGYTGYHILLSGTDYCEIRDSYIHNDPSDTLRVYDSMYDDNYFSSYGVHILSGGASYNLIENNIFDWFRHNMVIQEYDDTDPQNNVFGYNYCWNTYTHDGTHFTATTAMEFHNGSKIYNLIEGNVIESAGIGNNDPHNTLLRNRINCAGVKARDYSYIIGNEFTEIKNPNMSLSRWGNYPNVSGDNSIIHGNYVTVGSGLQWDPSISDQNIPNSYYLSGRPEWFGDLDWPCYGGDLMPGNRKRSPAEVWYWTMMFPEETPSNLQGSNMGNDVVLTWNRESDPGREIDYIVCKSRDNVRFYRIGETTNTSYTDTEADNGHNYYYIRARNYLGGRNHLGELTVGDGLGGESDPTETIHVLVGGTSVDATSVTVSPANTTIEVGEDLQLAATVLPSDATNKLVSWSSDNIYVATVNAYGVVKGVSEGVATITVTTIDGGFTATSSITVDGTITMEQTHLEKKDFSVFPNPAKDVLHFTFPENQAQKISIYSSLGKLVSEEKYMDNLVNISGLDMGIYFLVIKGIRKSYHAKFIVR